MSDEARRLTLAGHVATGAVVGGLGLVGEIVRSVMPTLRSGATFVFLLVLIAAITMLMRRAGEPRRPPLHTASAYAAGAIAAAVLQGLVFRDIAAFVLMVPVALTLFSLELLFGWARGARATRAARAAR
jgi:hypothetical protein